MFYFFGFQKLRHSSVACVHRMGIFSERKFAETSFAHHIALRTGFGECEIHYLSAVEFGCGGFAHCFENLLPATLLTAMRLSMTAKTYPSRRQIASTALRKPPRPSSCSAYIG